jgi:hypothetical protein
VSRRVWLTVFPVFRPWPVFFFHKGSWLVKRLIRRPIDSKFSNPLPLCWLALGLFDGRFPLAQVLFLN